MQPLQTDAPSSLATHSSSQTQWPGDGTPGALQLTNRRLQLSLITHQLRLKLHSVVKPIANGLDVIILRCARRRQGRSGSRGGCGQSRAHALEWRRMGTLGIGRVDSSSGFIGG